MASVIDAFNDAFADRFAFVKFAIYAVPVYFCTQFFIKGQMEAFYTLTTLTALLLFGLMTCAINNVRENNQEVLTFNPVKLGWVSAKTSVAVVPVGFILWLIGTSVLKIIPIPQELGMFDNIIKIIIWALLGSIMLTSYLAFAKFLDIKQAYNFSIISDSCIDMFVNLCFFAPQLLLVDLILFSPLFYAVYYFKVSYEHVACVAYFSIIVIVNVSIISNYLAQAAYEIIKGKDGDYDNKHTISFLDVDDEERGN